MWSMAWLQSVGKWVLLCWTPPFAHSFISGERRHRLLWMMNQTRP